VNLRPYQKKDFAECLAIFRSNTPLYFVETELESFMNYLKVPGNFFVVTDDDNVVACGGVAVQSDQATLVWGMVTRSRQRQGFGAFLLQARLAYIARHYPTVRRITLQTTQHAQGFYDKFGFVTQTVTWNAYAPQLHRYDMALSVTTSQAQQAVYTG
jgi:ribosomal protein S18 acetylase RimI-like enzyme